MKSIKSKLTPEELWKILCYMDLEQYDSYLQIIEEVNHFKFRAECESDVNKLRKIIGNRCLKIVMIIRSFPDTEVDLYSTLNLDELRDKMANISDGHVMLQTVEFAENYTGERNYELE